MAIMSDAYLGWYESYTNHKVCMHHLIRNYMTRFKDKILKNLVSKVAIATMDEKFNKNMDIIVRINAEA